jgi:hypothetical protein
VPISNSISSSISRLEHIPRPASRTIQESVLEPIQEPELELDSGLTSEPELDSGLFLRSILRRKRKLVEAIEVAGQGKFKR